MKVLLHQEDLDVYHANASIKTRIFLRTWHQKDLSPFLASQADSGFRVGWAIAMTQSGHTDALEDLHIARNVLTRDNKGGSVDHDSRGGGGPLTPWSHQAKDEN